ncbi:hypothetical protein O181_101260 [Austropuccinia psidii MF-1]|uniref:Uncharacterized protein n=1 Tax=Austropuccinia psidii MF-1 TaxID=1389203 RepID=A0A9Q3PHK9_9BASI|nr:hypothetical protein [Austropuccinia psidii MF-1]
MDAEFPPKLLAATLIQSLNSEKYLTSLIQTLYDNKHFTPASVINLVSRKHSRCQTNEQALFAGSPNKLTQKTKWDYQRQINKGQRNGKMPDRTPLTNNKVIQTRE